MDLALTQTPALVVRRVVIAVLLLAGARALPLDALPALWHLPLDQYLARTGAPLGERLQAALVAAQVLVLLIAASGVLAGGGH